ncbi:selenium-binding protein 2 isoform X2 [Rosa chinensis]|nr:selenium-binding protein 2 isoform X2 [Rosa chinensis]
MMIDYVVVPVASSFGLEEDYKYLTRSMREFLTGHIYVIDTKTDPEAPSLHKVVDPEDVVQKIGLAYPHTSHCLASGDFFSLTQSLMSREGLSSEAAGRLSPLLSKMSNITVFFCQVIVSDELWLGLDTCYHSLE